MRRKAKGPTSVLDASALLAFLQRERGYEVVRPRVRTAAMGSVNLEEVLVKSRRAGKAPERLLQLLLDLGLRIVPHSIEDAVTSAQIDGLVGQRGRLSLGDRACLALGMRLGIAVFTAERSWESLGLDAQIRTIR